MEIDLDKFKNKHIDPIMLHKMAFLYNALENGWSIKKKREQFIFTKKHEGKMEVFDEKYLETFIQSNFDMNLLKHT